MRRIGDLIYTSHFVSGDEDIQKVAGLFSEDPRLDAVAAVETDRTFGLVLRSRLMGELGRRFGYSLFARKPVRIFKEPDFLVCDAEAEPVQVIAAAARRDEARIYDDIVVTERGGYLGLVSMRLLMAHSKDLLIESMANVGALETQNRRLDELNRQQREFVANITHELRAPLNTMLGVANLLSMDDELPAGRLRDVEMLLSRGRDLQALVNNLLELHRIEAGEVKPCLEVLKLRPLLDDCLASTHYALRGRPVSLESDYRELPERVVTDAVLLRRILINLLSNAAKFTEAGKVVLSACPVGSEFVVSVTDTGPGIRDEDLPRLFRKFVQLEATRTKSHSGTGLGLAIVRDLVDILGGRVNVTSCLGQGTTFSVTLPAQARPHPL